MTRSARSSRATARSDRRSATNAPSTVSHRRRPAARATPRKISHASSASSGRPAAPRCRGPCSPASRAPSRYVGATEQHVVPALDGGADRADDRVGVISRISDTAISDSRPSATRCRASDRRGLLGGPDRGDAWNRRDQPCGRGDPRARRGCMTSATTPGVFGSVARSTAFSSMADCEDGREAVARLQHPAQGREDAGGENTTSAPAAPAGPRSARAESLENIGRLPENVNRVRSWSPAGPDGHRAAVEFFSNRGGDRVEQSA